MSDNVDSTTVQGDSSILPAVMSGIALLLVLAAIAVGAIYVSRRTAEVAKASETPAGRNANRAGQARQGGGRQTATDRMQQRLRRRRQAAAQAGDGAEPGSGEEGDGSDAEGAPLHRREARRAAREGAAAAQQQAPRTKQQAYEARRAARDAAREEEERKLEAEVARLQAEREAAEAAEAAQWMSQISVEGEGTAEAEEEEAQSKMAEFVEFVRARKTVALDELGAEFGLRTADAIARVQALEAEGRLTGVMDDRGKFIYISPEEMAAVAAFIKQRGRVAIAELAGRSDEFIDLEAKAEAPAAGGDTDEELFAGEPGGDASALA